MLLLGLLAAAASPPSEAQKPVTIGLDHIAVAVSDLERAAATYRALGFALKPGRHHDNGIRNAHVKFPDGSGIELLTAPKAVDGLSGYYVELLRAGAGPAFFSLHARDTEQLHVALRKGGHEFRHDGEITKLAAPEFAYLLIVRNNRSPTDRPEHFAHVNGATAQRTVWIATQSGEALARLLVQLGGVEQRRQVLAPDPAQATVVTLAEGEVFILPEQHQLISGRPVIGASFSVRDLAKLRRILGEAGIEPRAAESGAAERVVVEPKITHGLWLEFREAS